MSLDMPVTDSDGNNLPDWLQTDKECNITVNGSSSVSWHHEKYTPRNRVFSVEIYRKQGKDFGEMTAIMSDLSTYPIKVSWTVPTELGDIFINKETKNIIFENWVGDTNGSASLISADNNGITLDDLSLPINSEKLEFQKVTLQNSGKSFSGTVICKDRNSETSSADYTKYHIQISDHDYDMDGIPNILDDSLNELKSFESTKSLGFDWYNSEIFNTFFAPQINQTTLKSNSFSLWIYHEYLGWVYLQSWPLRIDAKDGFDCWFYVNKNWLYSSSLCFPYFYKDSSRSWLYLDSENKNPFYDFDSETWVEAGEI